MLAPTLLTPIAPEAAAPDVEHQISQAMQPIEGEATATFADQLESLNPVTSRVLPHLVPEEHLALQQSMDLTLEEADVALGPAEQEEGVDVISLAVADTNSIAARSNVDVAPVGADPKRGVEAVASLIPGPAKEVSRQHGVSKLRDSGDPALTLSRDVSTITADSKFVPIQQPGIPHGTADVSPAGVSAGDATAVGVAKSASGISDASHGGDALVQSNVEESRTREATDTESGRSDSQTSVPDRESAPATAIRSQPAFNEPPTAAGPTSSTEGTVIAEFDGAKSIEVVANPRVETPGVSRQVVSPKGVFEVAPEVITDQISKHIISANQSISKGTARLEVSLDPPELGRITIELSEVDEQLTAKLIVSDNAVVETVRRSIPAMLDSLVEAGMSVDDFQLDTAASDQHRSDQEADPLGLNETPELSPGDVAGSAGESAALGPNGINILA